MKENSHNRIKLSDLFNGIYGTVPPGQEANDIRISQEQKRRIQQARANVVRRKMRHESFEDLQERYNGQ